jgi:hypothetical protein
LHVIDHEHERRQPRVELEEAAQHRARDPLVLFGVVLEHRQERAVGEAEAQVRAEEVQDLADAAVTEDARALGAEAFVRGALVVERALLGRPELEAVAEQTRDGAVGRPLLGGTPVIDARRLSALGQPVRPLGEQAALADALVSDHGHELRRAVADGALEHVGQGVELHGAADQRAPHPANRVLIRTMTGRRHRDSRGSSDSNRLGDFTQNRPAHRTFAGLI